MKKLILGLVTASSFLFADVNLITDRSDFHTDWLVEKFTKDTGIKVNVLHTEKGLVDRAKKETDVIVFTKDALKLVHLDNEGALINHGVGTKLYNTDKFIITSGRTRGFYVKKGTEKPLTYDDLLSHKYQGKICVRKFSHNYNLSLFASLMERHGKKYTETYINILNSQLARKPKSNDRGQVKGIYDGECDISIGNSYYLGLMEKDPEQSKWANSVDFVTPKDPVTLYSGVGMTKATQDNVQFLEFVTSDEVQKLIHINDFEFTGITDIDSNLYDIVKYKKDVYKIVQGL